MVNITDQEILNGVKKKDDKVIKYLIKCYFPQVKRFVINNKGSASDAEDVMQETLVIVYEKISQNKLKINCRFGTYLYGIVKIVWFKELKKRSKEESVNFKIDEEILDSGMLNQLERRERTNIYREYFEKLGSECKKLLELFFKGEKIKTITSLMGYNSDQHTKNKKYICKKHLIENIRANPKFNEIKNERLNNISEIPRW